MKNMLHPIQGVHMQASSPAIERDANWDSFEWEGLGWDEHQHFLKESESWMDLKSSSHWEESKSNILATDEDIKPSDDATKYEEEEEIIDSWLNDDGFGSVTQELGTQRIASNDPPTERRPSPFSNMEQVLASLPKILLTRDVLERWLNEPYFNRLVKGCFVRVKVGEIQDTPVYRIAHIDEAQDSCFFTYNLSRMQTTKGLSLQIGTNRKVFPIAAISNQPPTESDVQTWQEEMIKCNMIWDPIELQQKEEIVRVLHLKYPAVEFRTLPTQVEPMINEPFWNPIC